MSLLGFTFVATSPELLSLVEACERRELSTWERGFVGSVRTRRNPPTEKQLSILKRIAEGAPNYAAINAAALRLLHHLVERWLPDGKAIGREFVALNPKRGDRTKGSFAVNLRTGEWADFATGDKGGDPIALAAFLFDLSQAEAARKLASMLGLLSEGGSVV